MTSTPSELARETFDRERMLSDRLNSFFVEVLGLPPKNYYAALSTEAILSLKSTLADINNILTMKVTLAFANWVVERLAFDADARATLRRTILETKPSANGWDVQALLPHPFVAEVKCNVPINRGRVYGSAQRHGIERDVQSLMRGKPKAALHSEDVFRFLVFLDTPEIRQANDHLMRVSAVCRAHLVFIDPSHPVERRDIVHGIHVRV